MVPVGTNAHRTTNTETPHTHERKHIDITSGYYTVYVVCIVQHTCARMPSCVEAYRKIHACMRCVVICMLCAYIGQIVAHIYTYTHTQQGLVSAQRGGFSPLATLRCVALRPQISWPRNKETHTQTRQRVRRGAQQRVGVAKYGRMRRTHRFGANKGTLCDATGDASSTATGNNRNHTNSNNHNNNNNPPISHSALCSDGPDWPSSS